jgi:hypothetical protein
MRNTFIVAALTLYCALPSGCTSERAEAPSPPTAPAPENAAPKPTAAATVVPAELTGFGNCRANRCTVHFAQASRGDGETLVVQRCEPREPKCEPRTGQLTAAAKEQASALAARLAAEPLKTTYGCPGCVDGPAYTFVVHRPDGRATEHSVDPLDPQGLPASLNDALAFARAAVTAVDECTANALMQPAPSCEAIMMKTKGLRMGVP